MIYCRDRHDRLSVVAALTLSARRGRIGLYFAAHRRNITAEEVEAFQRQVQRSLGRRLTVVLDRWGVIPPGGGTARALSDDRRFWIEWLPPCAPDLNAVQYVWDHSTYGTLADYIPENLLDLEVEFPWSVCQIRTCPDLLRSFYHGAELKP